MHIYPAYLVVFVGVVIIYTLVRIAAGGVQGYFILISAQLAAAPLLIHAAEDVEELTHTGALVICREGTELREDGTDRRRYPIELEGEVKWMN